MCIVISGVTEKVCAFIFNNMFKIIFRQQGKSFGGPCYPVEKVLLREPTKSPLMQGRLF